MSKRMTAAEVVEAMRKTSGKAWVTVRNGNEIQLASALNEVATTLPALADAVEQHLTPQVLDEPDGDGDYWIDGREGVHRIEWSAVRQMWYRRSSMWWEPIEKARVAKVPPGPVTEETSNVDG